MTADGHPEVVLDEEDSTSGSAPVSDSSKKHPTPKTVQDAVDAAFEQAEQAGEMRDAAHRMISDARNEGAPYAQYLNDELGTAIKHASQAIGAAGYADIHAARGDIDKVREYCYAAAESSRECEEAVHKVRRLAARDNKAGIVVEQTPMSAVRRGHLIEVEGDWWMVDSIFRDEDDQMIRGRPLFGGDERADLARGADDEHAETGTILLRNIPCLSTGTDGETSGLANLCEDMDWIVREIGDRSYDISEVDRDTVELAAEWQPGGDNLHLVEDMTLVEYCEHLQRLTTELASHDIE